MLACMAAVHAYQILDERRGEALLPGFEALAGAGVPRADWGGYEAIRARLMGAALDAQAFYGFFSTAHGVPPLQSLRDAAAQAAGGTDVLLLDRGGEEAYFWNVFEQGESCHPGLLAVAQRCFARIGRPQPLQSLASDSRHTAGPDAFVARPRFWRLWLDISEALYAIAEDPADDLGAALRLGAGARGSDNRPMKVLIVERVATFLLMTDASLKVETCEASPAPTRRRLALACDALKMAYATTGRSQYRVVFRWLRGFAVSRSRAG